MGVSAPELPAEERAGDVQGALPRIPALLEAFDAAFAAAGGRGAPADETGGQAEVVRELLARASAPYDGFVHADPEEAARAGRCLRDAAAGEAAPPHLRLACEPQGVVGCLAALPWTALPEARLRAARALARAGLLADAGVRERIRIAASALLEPAAGDAYLARIAVAPGARRRGIARRLLEALAAGAQRAGFRRIVLEVSTASTAAIALYGALGYEELDRRSVASPCGTRRLEYAHMARPLQPLPLSDSSSGSGSGTRP